MRWELQFQSVMSVNGRGRQDSGELPIMQETGTIIVNVTDNWMTGTLSARRWHEGSQELILRINYAIKQDATFTHRECKEVKGLMRKEDPLHFKLSAAE